MAIDPNSRPLVLRPGVQWDPNTRTASGTGSPTPTPPQSVPPSGPKPAPPAASASASPPPVQGDNTNPWHPRNWGNWLQPQSWTFADTNPNVPAQDPTPGLTVGEIPQWTVPEGWRAPVKELGWQVEMPADQAPNTPTALVDMGNVELLTEHTYQVNAKDWDALQRLYGGGADTSAAAPEIRGGYIQAAPMTEQAYANLNDDQRAAVDFNTLLVDAREQDLKKQLTLEGADLESYKADVADVFGEGGDSSIIAPQTIRLLKDAKFTAPGQDLDDFLSLEAGVALDDLLDFKMPPLPIIKPKQPVADGLPNRELADFTTTRNAENRELTAALAARSVSTAITNALKDATVRQPDWLSTAQTALGTRPTDAAIPWGWDFNNATRTTPEEQQKEQRFHEGYDYLINAENKSLDNLWAGLTAAKWSESEIDELFNFFDEYSKYELRTGVQREGRSPQDIRTLAGLEG